MRRCAHVEYSNGFVVFDRYDKSHEVWVKATKAHQFQEFSRPHPSQLQASEEANSNAEDPRGRFVPHLVLRNPVRTRAYRFVFPELLVASEEEKTAHIWNVVEGRIVEAYSLAEGLGPAPDPDEDGNENDAAHGSINYVELSPNHVFVCFNTKLVVYQRASGSFGDSERNNLPSGPPCREAVPVFVLPHTFYSSEPRRLSVSHLADGARSGTAYPITSVQSPSSTLPNIVQPRACFSAVHVSPDGGNLVAATIDGILFFARNFSDRTDKRKVWGVDVRSPIYNLAFDGTRVAFSAVRTTYPRSESRGSTDRIIQENGVFVLQILSRPGAQNDVFPAKAIYNAYGFGPVGGDISCLQLTRTSLWQVFAYRFSETVP